MAADYMLYDYFHARFKQKLQLYGEEKMNSEVQKLKIANKEKIQMCQVESMESLNLSGSNKWWNNKVIGYSFAQNISDECKYYTMSELAFLDHLR